MVAYALSRKFRGSLAALLTQQPSLLKEIEEMQIEVQVREPMMMISQINQVGVKSISMIKSRKHNRRTIRPPRLSKKYKEEKLLRFYCGERPTKKRKQNMYTTRL